MKLVIVAGRFGGAVSLPANAVWAFTTNYGTVEHHICTKLVRRMWYITQGINADKHCFLTG